MNIKREDLPAIFSLGAVGLVIAIPVIILMGLFVLFPLAIIFVAIAFIKWQKRQPVPTAALHEQISPVFPDEETFVSQLIDRILTFPRYPCFPLFEALVQAGAALYRAEEMLVKPMRLYPKGSAEEARYRDTLIAYQRKAAEPGVTLEVFLRTLCVAFETLIALLPDLATTDRLETANTSLFHAELEPLLASKADAVKALSEPFFDALALEIPVFANLRKQLRENEIEASLNSRTVVAPENYKGNDIVGAYLGGTPLEAVLRQSIPWELPEETRFSGHWIIAPQGKGKTTLLTAMLDADFKRDASVIIFDGKGDLIEEVGRLAFLKDRYVVIDPRSTGINPLAVDASNIPQAAERLEYVFSALLEAKITPLQTVLFRNVFRALVTAFPNPTLETFQDLLLNGFEAYRAYIDTLRSDLKEFFYKQYNRDAYVGRRNEVLSRVDLLLSNDHIRNMLLQSTQPFRIAEAMDAGKVIIINNSVNLLGEQGSEFVGRYFLSEIWAAATARSGQQFKKPCYVYIDEAHRVIHRDEKVGQIIDECRSQKIALIMAHQRIDQITLPSVLTALGNCAIRYANSDEEARILAQRMRVTPDYLQSLKVGEFAAFVRDVSKTVTISVTPADFKSLPKLQPKPPQPIETPPVHTDVSEETDSWDKL